MNQDNFATAVELMVKNVDLVAEFIEFDCQGVINNPNNLKHIEAVVDQYLAMNRDKLKQNELYSSILFALDGCEKELGQVISELTWLKKEYLSKLNLPYVKPEHIVGLMQIVIDTWYNLTDCYSPDAEWNSDATNFTKDAAALLSQAMYWLKFSDETKSHEFLKNMALILVKNMYGQNYGISVSLPISISVQQIMLLIAFNEGKSKLPVSEMNHVLGTEGFIYEYTTPIEHVTETEQKSVLASGNGLCFFDEKAAETTKAVEVTSRANSSMKQESLV